MKSQANIKAEKREKEFKHAHKRARRLLKNLSNEIDSLPVKMPAMLVIICALSQSSSRGDMPAGPLLSWLTVIGYNNICHGPSSCVIQT